MNSRLRDRTAAPKPVLLAILLIALATLLTACGGQGDTGSSGGTSQNGTTQSETTGASADIRTYPLPGEEVYPEGVVYDEATGDFYVSATGDGAIFRGVVGKAGQEAEIFLDGGLDDRTSAAGLALDGEGRLFVSGGETGRMFVYDTQSGDLVDSFQSDRQETFVNDVILTPAGDAYFTDSYSPVLYRLTPAGDGYEFEEWLDLGGTSIEYADGFNVNGIVSAADGRYLILTQTNIGQLFRVDTESQEVTEIDLGGGQVTGDGMVLDGQMLYAVSSEEVLPVELSEDFASGQIGEGFSYPSFASPSTIAKYDERLLVVNSQFAARESGNPELPFTISDVPIP